MESCSFCHTRKGEAFKTFYRCSTCKRLSKDARKGTGLYFLVDELSYTPGRTLAKYISSLPSSKALVIDLEKTLNLLSPSEFADYTTKLQERGWTIVILSYVGTTTATRVAAHQEILGYTADFRVLCFRRGDMLNPGNKGYLLGLLRNFFTELIFLDDSEDHVTSGLLAKADARQIQSKESLEEQLSNLSGFTPSPEH